MKRKEIKRAKDFLYYKLKDGDQLYGGIAFEGEILKDFLEDAGIPEDTSMRRVNAALKECGIKPIMYKADTACQSTSINIVDMTQGMINIKNFYGSEPIQIKEVNTEGYAYSAIVELKNGDTWRIGYAGQVCLLPKE